MDPASVRETEEALASLGVTGKTLTGAQRRTLAEVGYLILPGAVGPEELRRLRSAFDRACDDEAIPPRGTRHPSRLLDAGPGFLRFPMHPGVLAAVLHVRGRPFHVGIAGRDPMPGFGQQGLHTPRIASISGRRSRFRSSRRSV